MAGMRLPEKGGIHPRTPDGKPAEQDEKDKD